MPVPPRPRRAALRGTLGRDQPVLACTFLLLVVLVWAPFQAQQLNLPEPRNVAPGVLLYHLDSPSLVDPEGPISIWALRLDPARVDLQAALANDEIMGVETVGGHCRAPQAGRRDQRRLLPAQRRPGGRDDD